MKKDCYSRERQRWRRNDRWRWRDGATTIVDANRRRFLAERRAEATTTIVDAESTTMNEMSWYSDGEARARRRLRGDRRGHDALTDGDGVLAAGDGVRLSLIHI